MNDLPNDNSQNDNSAFDDDSIIIKNVDRQPNTPNKKKGGLGEKFSTIKEMMLFFSSGKRWWMAPLVLLLGVIGLVLVILQSLEYVAPFIYVAF